MIKAQAAFEYFILAVIVIAVSAAILFAYSNVTSNTTASFQAQSSVQTLQDELTKVHDMGYPAVRTLRLEIPDSVVPNRTFIENNTIQISYYSSNGIIDVFRSVDFNISGALPTSPGVYWLKLMPTENDTINIYVMSFSFDPTKISTYISKYGEKDYNLTITNTGNATISVNISTQNLGYMVDVNSSDRTIQNFTTINNIPPGGSAVEGIRLTANQPVGNYYGNIVLQSDNISSNIPIAIGIRDRIFPVNTTIIPLDNNQANILKAYGFAYNLLKQDIPVGWIMDNITLNTTELGNYNYRGSTFVVDYPDNTWLDSQAAIWNVTLNHLNQTLNGDYVTWLAFAPRIAVQEGGKYWVVTETLNASGIPYSWVNGQDIINGALSNYDVLLVGHYDFEFNSPNPVEETDAIRKFIENGGYLHAECVSVTSFEYYQHITNITSSRNITSGDYMIMYQPYSPLTQTFGTPKDIGGTVSGFNITDSNVTLLATDNFGYDKFVYTPFGNGYISYYAGHLGDNVDGNISRMRLLDNIVLFTSAEKGKTGPIQSI